MGNRFTASVADLLVLTEIPILPQPQAGVLQTHLIKKIIKRVKVRHGDGRRNYQVF